MPLINVSSTSNPKSTVIDPPNFNSNSVDPTSQVTKNIQRELNDGGKEVLVNVKTNLSQNGIKETKAEIVSDTKSESGNEFESYSVGPEIVSDVTQVQHPQASTTNNQLENRFEKKLSNVQDLNNIFNDLNSQPIRPNKVQAPNFPQVNNQPQMNNQPQVNNQPQALKQATFTEQESPNVQKEYINTQELVKNNLNYNTFDFFNLLKYAIAKKASDIHLTVGYRPMIRVDGSLEIMNSPILASTQINQTVLELIKLRHDMNISSIFEADLTYTFNNRRFRINIFKEMTNFAIVMRIIPDSIVAVDSLGLPPVVKKFSNISNGLVLVTGPTGSGKSTTIASLINLINLTQPKHIITLEDPIEFVFPKGLGLVDQREYGVDFTSWDNALRAVLRQDPDVVLIGEMRDLPTIEAALQIAETGHLVFATLHTNGAAETINRVIDVFDSQKQDQIRIQLSSVLQAVVSQKLIILNGGGRKAAVEILISNASVRNAIRDKKTFQIDNIIQTNAALGMLTLEKSLINFIRDGSISLDYAKTVSSKPNELEILLKN